MTAIALQEITEDIPNDACIIEPAMNASMFFTGIRMHVVNGMTHLLFYCEQPTAAGEIEFMVVARMVGTSASFKASLDRFASQFRRPTSAFAPGRPLN
jgi:hypothetical protein